MSVSSLEHVWGYWLCHWVCLGLGSVGCPIFWGWWSIHHLVILLLSIAILFMLKLRMIPYKKILALILFYQNIYMLIWSIAVKLIYLFLQSLVLFCQLCIFSHVVLQFLFCTVNLQDKSQSLVLSQTMFCLKGSVNVKHCSNHGNEMKPHMSLSLF